MPAHFNVVAVMERACALDRAALVESMRILSGGILGAPEEIMCLNYETHHMEAEAWSPDSSLVLQEQKHNELINVYFKSAANAPSDRSSISFAAGRALRAVTFSFCDLDYSRLDETALNTISGGFFEVLAEMKCRASVFQGEEIEASNERDMSLTAACASILESRLVDAAILGIQEFQSLSKITLANYASEGTPGRVALCRKV